MCDKLAAISRKARHGDLELQKVDVYDFSPKAKHPLPALSAYWNHKEITISSLILQASQTEKMAGRYCSSYPQAIK